MVWGIGRESPALCLEFLFGVGREGQTSLVYWLWEQTISAVLLKSCGWGDQESLAG